MSVGDELRTMAGRLESVDFTPTLSVSRDEMATETHDSFMGSKTPEGVPWAPFKRPPVPMRKLLVKTGALMASALPSIMQGTIEPKRLTVDPAGLVPYGKFHRSGTSRMPRREFMELTTKLVSDTTERAAKQVGEILGG